ncbi:cyclodeaminase/cyclohydrolase family protein [Ferrovum sp.]|jgi:formiminotetrahydrofolate cyclodeaminase|uniref:cyclodeaminase/cyclohydrolase family protein n=1 Tax=Ferrovum sp. TaxID=2609467 RepID=UPI00261149A4|nr:cyclodeaminase/cyclohydrolase family protein [Ferrovum sp.]
MMTTQSIADFLEELASATPTPGGGGAAALMGAMGAGLIAMVAQVTVGKKGQDTQFLEMERQIGEADALRREFTTMISADAAAFDGLMSAFKLPKDSVEAIDRRAAIIQQGYQAATEVPLSCIRACLRGLALARRSAEQGHRNVLSDSGVAVHALLAALRSAILNVQINVPAIKDQAFVDAALNEVRAAEEEAGASAGMTLAVVTARLS